jgi:hypothetical protein
MPKSIFTNVPTSIAPSLQIIILSREQDTLDFSEGKTRTSNCCFRAAWNLLPPQADYCYSLLAHKLANDGNMLHLLVPFQV